jgi:tetratricopeptide (TPR) repeat protein
LKLSTFAAVLLVVVGSAAARAQENEKLKEAIRIAQKAFDSERYDEADRAFEGLAAEAQSSFEAMFLRARIGYALGEFGKAVTYSDEALKLDPKHAECWKLSGNALFAAGDEARNDGRSSSGRVTGFYMNSALAFEKAAELRPDDAELREFIGHAYYWSGEDKLEASAKAFEKAISMRPDSADAYAGLARTQLAIADFQFRVAEDQKSEEKKQAAAGVRAAAIATAAKGLAAKKLSDGTAEELAGAALGGAKAANDLSLAYGAFQGWIAAHPKSSAAHVWAGFVKVQMNDDAAAIEHFTKAWEISGKKNEVAAYELGMAAKRAGELEKAAELFATAHDLRAEGWGEFNPLAMISDAANGYIERRDYAKGIALAEKYGVPRGAKSWALHGNLGLWYRDWADATGRRGGQGAEAKPRNEAALKHYTKAVELILKDETATAAKKAQLVNDLGVIHHYQFGEMEKGLKFYRQAVEIDPTSVDPLENLGLCLNKLGKYEEAAEQFKKVLKQQPRRMVSSRGLAEAESKLKK